MAKTKKYVRILKTPDGSSWYSDKLGQVLPLANEVGDYYLAERRPEVSSFVPKKHAELIVTEKRPAEVGERVLITEKPVRKDYEIYEPVTVDNVNIYGVESYKNGRPIFLNHYEYEVIVNNEVKNEEADEMNKMLVDQAKTVFERKDDKYFGYKSRLGDIVIGGAYSYAFVVHYAKTNEDVVIIPGDVNAVTTPVCTTEEERLWKPEKTAQERRDEIVEQAKADVERLRMINRMLQTFDITFDINRESRTVEAVAKKPNSRTAFYGTAICAPDDCFNVHIGEAIALHRALGLEVPDEYLNAPQPTEVRVGDVVQYKEIGERRAAVVSNLSNAEVPNETYLRTALTTPNKIIDDSRTEVGE
ncbi:hypothetical protein MOB72_08140 [Bacillus licheniformis]|uniref:hypothetical protein n=1 Tax=Bacillus licheniformis TaxID=1402 RepID=UPI00228103EE|nr:hypothetical protein [Bacillus licheniformis]MCY7954722.1 hypothetical protein [Bacillus licheniformis]MCY9220554.1 hypothetical protein [Bacillus licheniformis]